MVEINPAWRLPWDQHNDARASHDIAGATAARLQGDIEYVLLLESWLTMKNTAAFGIYPDRTSVEVAVDRLKAEGFRNTDISGLFLANTGTEDFAHEKNKRTS
jgi:hypothetical protein